MSANYGIVYRNKNFVFMVPVCVEYGIPALFETELDAIEYARKRHINKYRIEDVNTVWKYVALLVEYFSERKIPVTDTDDTGRIKTQYVIDITKKTFAELHQSNIAFYKKEKLRRKVLKDGRFKATVKFKKKKDKGIK
jgi:hypothetical protein